MAIQLPMPQHVRNTAISALEAQAQATRGLESRIYSDAADYLRAHDFRAILIPSD